MKRREFITLLGGAVIAWPLAARAQQPAMPVVGLLNAGSREGSLHFIAGFHQGLKETGFVEGQNAALEYRWAEGRNDRLSALAADLVRRQVAAIVASSGSVLPAMAATTTIPIVLLTPSDPVVQKFVPSFKSPRLQCDRRELLQRHFRSETVRAVARDGAQGHDPRLSRE